MIHSVSHAKLENVKHEYKCGFLQAFFFFLHEMLQLIVHGNELAFVFTTIQK